MVRISHAASYFMPLFCSSQPYVVLVACITTTGIFVAFYMSSYLLAKQYDDPGLFKPVAQDYFRTSLLGVFSPILYYFVKTFLFNVNRRYLILNLLIDFPLNDWFILFIILCLAYPQQEQASPGESFNLWHIIPRQSYIFGLAWALGEFIICVTGNLFNYQELDTNPGEPLQPDSDVRDNITLAKCVGLRSISSTISQNVYCADYGSIRKPVDDTVVIDPTDNSMRMTSADDDEEQLKDANDWRATDAQLISRTFAPIKTKRELCIGVSLLCLVLTSNILLTIGESLIFCIFFIYMPHHEELFTKVVNYFGNKSLRFFLFTVLIPFTTANLLVNTMIYLWNDIDEWFNHSPETSPNPAADDYANFYESDLSLQRSVSSFAEENQPTLMLMSSPSELHYYNNNTGSENYDTDFLKILVIAKDVINAWRSAARKDSFVLSIMFIWGVTVFLTGLISTVLG